jgi:hypothetical protein
VLRTLDLFSLPDRIAGSAPSQQSNNVNVGAVVAGVVCGNGECLLLQRCMRLPDCLADKPTICRLACAAALLNIPLVVGS